MFICYFLRFSLWQIPHRETERWKLQREEGGGGGRVFCKVRERRLPPDNIEWIGGEGRRKWESRKKKKKEKLLPVAAHPRVGGWGNKSPPPSLHSTACGGGAQILLNVLFIRFLCGKEDRVRAPLRGSWEKEGFEGRGIERQLK